MPNWLPLVMAICSWADPAPPPPSPVEVVSALETALADAIARAEPAVVAIARVKSENDESTAVKGRNPAPIQSDPRMLPPQGDPFAVGTDALSFDFGSGVVVGDRGEILTNYHVVRGAGEIKVRAVNRQAFDAEIIAADPRSDLAVIAAREIPGVDPPKLKPIAIGDASKLRKGSFLLALGNPFNAARDGRASASWGILANIARRLEMPSDDQLGNRNIQLGNYPTLLQLDAKLNIGMSGGAVINLKGELVGLTTASANAVGFDAQAGYAIPMDAMGRRIVETLKQGKEVEYGFLGIRIDTAGSNRVMDARPGTPAGEGGVQADDAILAVGETPVIDADSLVLAINALPAGARVRLKLMRHNEAIERTVVLAKFPVDLGGRYPVIATNRPAPWRGLRVDYTSTLPSGTLSQDVLSAMAQGSVAVADVESGSPADKAGLKRGQVIKSVEGRKMSKPADFFEAVANRKGPVTVLTELGPVTVK